MIKTDCWLSNTRRVKIWQTRQTGRAASSNAFGAWLAQVVKEMCVEEASWFFTARMRGSVPRRADSSITSRNIKITLALRYLNLGLPMEPLSITLLFNKLSQHLLGRAFSLTIGEWINNARECSARRWRPDGIPYRLLRAHFYLNMLKRARASFSILNLLPPLIKTVFDRVSKCCARRVWMGACTWAFR